MQKRRFQDKFDRTFCISGVHWYSFFSFTQMAHFYFEIKLRNILNSYCTMNCQDSQFINIKILTSSCSAWLIEIYCLNLHCNLWPGYEAFLSFPFFPLLVSWTLILLVDAWKFYYLHGLSLPTEMNGYFHRHWTDEKYIPAECDIRSCLNTLQFLNKKRVALNIVSELVGYLYDDTINIYDILYLMMCYGADSIWFTSNWTER